MEQSLEFKQHLSQQQRLSSQMIQAVSLLALPTIDLCEQIYQEVEKNPALEIVKDASFEKIDIKIKNSNSDSLSKLSDADIYQSFLESSPSKTETLIENLLQQLFISNLNDEEKEIGNKIIQSLDEKGYFITSLEEIFTDKEEYEKALSVLPKIQKFDPIGVICKNLQESLELQAKEKLFNSEENPNNDIGEENANLIMEILHSNFDLLEKPRTSLIHRKLNEKGISCTLNQVELAINFIRTLDPYPARNFTFEKPIYVNPDVYIHSISKEELENVSEKEDFFPYEVELVKSNLPTIKISEDFLKFQDDNPQIKKAVLDASNFLNAVEQRNETLMKVCLEILKSQKDFFEKGVLYLKPLRLKDVAEKIGVHETTVSRISNEKYLQCEWGFFEIKYFFSNSVNIGKKDSGKEQGAIKENFLESTKSKESIKQELLIILNNSKGKKLSDQKLCEMLVEKGINIARRTVAKYRKELNFESSYDR